MQTAIQFNVARLGLSYSQYSNRHAVYKSLFLSFKWYKLWICSRYICGTCDSENSHRIMIRTSLARNSSDTTHYGGRWPRSIQPYLFEQCDLASNTYLACIQQEYVFSNQYLFSMYFSQHYVISID